MSRSRKEERAIRSWRHSTSSHEWPRRTLTARSRPTRSRWKGCPTAGWQRRVSVDRAVQRWLRERSSNEREFVRCIGEHDRALLRRMSIGSSTTTPCIVAGLRGPLFFQTRCVEGGLTLTFVSFEYPRSRS